MFLPAPKERIRGKCLLWLRKQYYNVVLEDAAGYDMLAWKGKISVGVRMVPDRESAIDFMAKKWRREAPAQLRVIFTFPGLIRNEDVPSNWGIYECYNTELFEKKVPKPVEEFDELAELDILGKLLTATDKEADSGDISAIVGVFRDCFDTSALNTNRNELIELLETGQFHYLLRGKDVSRRG